MAFNIKVSSYTVEFDNFIIRSAFQAIIHSDGKVFGYEALSRIQYLDTGQSVSPDIFFKGLDKLEKSREVIFEINRCHLMTFRLSTFYVPGIKIFLNLTPDFFNRVHEDKYILDQIKDLLSELGFYPGDVIAEITEDNSICDEKISKGVRYMSDEGFIIAIDDFGDKGSTLRRVQLCSPQIVKISRNLYLDTIENNRSYLIELIKYFHSIGALVVVEGIEERSHFDILKGVGVNFFQGFLFHKPELVEIVKGV